MTEIWRRRWFQFHLSTTLVLVFAAAGFIAINLLPSPLGTECFGLRQSSSGPAVYITEHSVRPEGPALFIIRWNFGFPETLVSKDYQVEARTNSTVGEVIAKVPITAGEFSSLDYNGLLGNSIWGLLLLFFLAVICEGTIRFRTWRTANSNTRKQL